MFSRFSGRIVPRNPDPTRAQRAQRVKPMQSWDALGLELTPEHPVGSGFLVQKVSTDQT